MEIEVLGEKATITLDSGFTLSATAPEAPILKNIYGSNISVEASDKELALQMQIVLKKGSNSQVKFGDQIIADLQFS